MTDTIAAMLLWIGSHTGYNIDVSAPNIVITESYHMCRLYGIKQFGQCDAAKLMGFYDKDLTIYLHAAFDIRRDSDRGRLVHELVHYIQWQNNKHNSSCLGLLEVEAYRVQDKWLVKHGKAPQADEFKLAMMSASCDT